MSKSPRHINSDQLVRELREGNREALKTLIQQFHPKMMRCIQHYTKAQEPAEDIAQECWYKILEHLDEVELKISFEAWALTIAKRKSIDWIREQQRMRKQDQKVKIEFGAEAEAEKEPYNEAEIKLQSVHIGIEQLPPTQKIVLKMFYLENLSLQEISDTLQVSTGTTKSRLFYARENLKKIISTLNHD